MVSEQILQCCGKKPAVLVELRKLRRSDAVQEPGRACHRCFLRRVRVGVARNRVRVSAGSDQTAIRQRSDSDQTAIRQRSDSHQTAIRQRPDSHQTAIRQPSDTCRQPSVSNQTLAGSHQSAIRHVPAAVRHACYHLRLVASAPSCLARFLTVCSVQQHKYRQSSPIYALQAFEPSGTGRGCPGIA